MRRWSAFSWWLWRSRFWLSSSRTTPTPPRTAAGKSRTLVAAQVVLDRIRNEAREAIFVDSPTVTAPGPELRFRKVDPAQAATRLPLVSPSPPPATWDPRKPDYLCQIRYYLQGTTLLREARLFDNSVVSSVLLQEVTNVACARYSDDSLNVTLAVTEAHQIRQVTTKIVRVLP